MKPILISLFLLMSAPASPQEVPCANQPFGDCNSQDYSSGDLKGWNTKRVLHPYSAQVVPVNSLSERDGQVPQSKNVVRFEIRRGDVVSEGFRSEVKERYNAEHGATIRYSLSLFIPKDYPIHEDHMDKNGHMLGCVYGQWHNEPNPGTNLAREPPFANYYINGDLQIYVKGLMAPWEYKSPDHFEAAVRRANDPFDKGDLVGEIKEFARGSWHYMQYEVRWLMDPNGFLKAWVDDRLVVDYHGPIGYADELGTYFKYGVYCKYDVTVPHVVYLGPYLRMTVAR